MKRPSRIVIVNSVIGALVIAGGLTSYIVLTGSSSAAATTTRTATVARGVVVATESASGTVQPATTADANFSADGTVSKIAVAVGQRVKKGQVLARLDATTANGQLQQAEASLTAARESLLAAEDAQTTASTSTTSSGSQSGGSGSSSSSISPEQAAANVASAQAQVDGAEVTLEEAQQAVDATVLRAPIAGTVTAVNGSVGSSSSGSSSSSSGSGSSGSSGSGSSGSGSSGSGSSSGGAATTSSVTSASSTSSSGFITISDLRNLEVAADFSETDTASLKVGQPATVTFDALPTVQVSGRVVSISPTATTVSSVVDYAVTVSLRNPPAVLRDGETATVDVITAEAGNALYVPSAAVTTLGTGSTVTVVRDGKHTVTPVKVGVQGATTTQITSGLTVGEQVVLSTSSGTGGSSLFPGGGFGAFGGGFGGAAGRRG